MLTALTAASIALPSSVAVSHLIGQMVQASQDRPAGTGTATAATDSHRLHPGRAIYARSVGRCTARAKPAYILLHHRDRPLRHTIMDAAPADQGSTPNALCPSLPCIQIEAGAESDLGTMTEPLEDDDCTQAQGRRTGPAPLVARS